ncbi:unnamed protein product [Bursaphelenchus xylophilus]|uniref:(pine wood nematode) hypothetical protein n=1 Tax=Bursaphelenchus xylophilus TaxID=6326 RepID=A0A1I7SE54_BURXY|nr:unnamed protein product [Bursaphelenchus xylophilus]CAG9104169.1 unnamed protein product [Bursaphelenchus xylophilus]
MLVKSRPTSDEERIGLRTVERIRTFNPGFSANEYDEDFDDDGLRRAKQRHEEEEEVEPIDPFNPTTAGPDVTTAAPDDCCGCACGWGGGYPWGGFSPWGSMWGGMPFGGLSFGGMGAPWPGAWGAAACGCCPKPCCKPCCKFTDCCPKPCCCPSKPPCCAPPLPCCAPYGNGCGVCRPSAPG